MAIKINSSELNLIQNCLQLFALNKHFDICQRSTEWAEQWHQYFRAVSLLNRGDQRAFLT